MSAVSVPSRSRWPYVFVSAFLGTAIEQYDFLLYGTASALVFSKIFFPNLDPLAGTIASLGTYAAGYFARGAGALICGHFGDRIGRKKLLLATLLVMGVASTAVGCLPTYAMIGLWAPVLLTTLRVLQGFAIGGEQSGAIVLGVESAPAHRRGLYGSWSNSGSYGGALLSTGALLLTSLLPEPAFLSWGWRVPFLFSAVLVVIGLVGRAKLPETPEFKQLQATRSVARFPLRDLLRDQPRQVLIVFMARFGEITWSVFVLLFTVAYVTVQLKLPRSVILGAVMSGAAVGVFTVPLFAALSDRIGRKPLYLFGLLVCALYVWPYFSLLNTRDPLLITLAIVVALGVVHPLMYGPQGGFFADMFDARVRFSGVSIGAIGAVIGGGINPVICSSLLAQRGGDPYGVAWYITGSALFAACFVAWTPKRTAAQSTGAEPHAVPGSQV
ncbi:MFS transporter [Paraburkholderia megapolitana]|uniref:Major Facilitator Superfamily protein n=1 Tax=Paraburkholderia megapolitana TaxID=420953 RepID=A0A1I3EP94_9BURK|nr:MFS transporter [Paraburkholderia megapolitana]SFI00693.1 Major Facilitator Superfamily protein [Paraburkholderia megapolitana]